ncbi:hypothetical protein PCK1_003099 [Pneumocystis canis]|nr:hypothetical protein PCK1_003099 [Pneumocystis canis]
MYQLKKNESLFERSILSQETSRLVIASEVEQTEHSNINNGLKSTLERSWIDAWQEYIPNKNKDIPDLQFRHVYSTRSHTSSSCSSEIWFDESQRSRKFNDEPSVEYISETTLGSEFPPIWETIIHTKDSFSLSNESHAIYGFTTHKSLHTDHTNVSLSTSLFSDMYSKTWNLCSLCKKSPQYMDQSCDGSQINFSPHTCRYISQSTECIGLDMHSDPLDPILDTHSMHSKKSSSSSVKTNLYKTELCRNWEENGECRYGLKCQFAHGHSELRSLLRHPKYKTSPCKTFTEIGSCPYGQRCCFSHIKELVKPGRIDATQSFENTIPPHTRLFFSKISNPSDPRETNIRAINTAPLFQKTLFSPKLSELNHIFNNISLFDKISPLSLS